MCFRFYSKPLVIVHDLNLMGVPIAPGEAEPPLIVDAHAVLPFSISEQCLQAIPWRRCQVAQFRRAIQLPKLSACDLLDRLKAPAALATVKPLCFHATERPDHQLIIFRLAFNVKR